MPQLLHEKHTACCWQRQHPQHAPPRTERNAPEIWTGRLERARRAGPCGTSGTAPTTAPGGSAGAPPAAPGIMPSSRCCFLACSAASQARFFSASLIFTMTGWPLMSCWEGRGRGGG